MNTIIIDVTRLLGRLIKQKLPTGVDRVSLAYIRHFGNRARAAVRIGSYPFVLSQRCSSLLFNCLLNHPVDYTRTIIALLNQESLNISGYRIPDGALLFNTGHDGLQEASYFEKLKKGSIKPIVMLHDLIPIQYPEYCRPGVMEVHCHKLNNVLSFASGVITNSESTLHDFSVYAGKAGRKIPVSVAAPIAPAELPQPSLIRPIQEPYFVVLGTIEPRKNHLLLLHIWRKLIERSGNRAPRLVIIGQRGWECENVLDLLERCESLRGYVSELPACTDSDLATYLYHSQALLFPSFAEGYGMPIMEALKFDIPVIASDLPVFREIAGNIPDYLDPLDSIGWMERIEAYLLPTHPHRTAQSHRRSDFQLPSWSSHFHLVELLMERLS